jgi:predicted 3-demethylubiquinone-9 3-methyltransferase (glyoxalase superfamily)
MPVGPVAPTIAIFIITAHQGRSGSQETLRDHLYGTSEPDKSERMMRRSHVAHVNVLPHLCLSSQGGATVSRIVPNLWYTDKAEEAAAFYASILPNSKVDAVTALPADSPSGPAGSVKIVEFTLMGQLFMAFSAGPLDAFNHSISFMVQCDDQTEIDRLWAALSDGGKVERCGWLKDRYGLYWQIAPSMPWRHDERSGSDARQTCCRSDVEHGQTRH